MQTDNIIILADDNFNCIEKKTVKNTKIMTKNWEDLISAKSVNFNRAQIKLDLNNIYLTKNSHVGGIFLVTTHDANCTNLKRITKKKLLHKKKYLAQRIKRVYIISIY